MVVYDPYVTEPVAGTSQARSLKEAVAEADYVSLHMPLTPETHHLVDDTLIAAMTRTPFIVNTSAAASSTSTPPCAPSTGAYSGA